MLPKQLNKKRSLPEEKNARKIARKNTSLFGKDLLANNAAGGAANQIIFKQPTKLQASFSSDLICREKLDFDQRIH